MTNTQEEFIADLTKDYVITGILTSQLLMNAQIEDQVRKWELTGNLPHPGYKGHIVPREICDQIITDYRGLQIAATRFWHVVWNDGGLAETVRNAEVTGHQARTWGLKLLVKSSAGRVLFTLRRKKQWVSLITIEDEGTNAGIQGLKSKPGDALRMINDCCDAWEKGKMRVREGRTFFG